MGVERVGRHDHFFELGRALAVVDSCSGADAPGGLQSDVRALFTTPTLAELARTISKAAMGGPAESDSGRAASGLRRILSLVSLTEEQMERIVATVPGGSANVEDIYALAPLQEGILFHHLLQREGDPYVLSVLLSFPDRARLEGYALALLRVLVVTIFCARGLSGKACRSRFRLCGVRRGWW